MSMTRHFITTSVFTHDILLKFFPTTADDAGVQDSKQTAPSDQDPNGTEIAIIKVVSVVRTPQIYDGNIYSCKDSGTSIGADLVLGVNIQAFHKLSPARDPTIIQWNDITKLPIRVDIHFKNITKICI